MKELILTVTAILVILTASRGQSFEGTIHWELSTKSYYGPLYDKPAKATILKIKGGDVFAKDAKDTLRSASLYLANQARFFFNNDVRKEYTALPEPRQSEVMITAAPEVSIILGHKCAKYVVQWGKELSAIVWMATDLPVIDGFAVTQILPGFPYKKFDGIPLAIEATQSDAVQLLKAVEIKEEKLDISLFQLKKGYTVVELD